MAVSAWRGRVVTPEEVLDDGVVVLDGARIAWVGGLADAPAEHAGVVGEADEPPAGTTLLPGLVDLHCHGGAGASFPDAADAETAAVAVREHLRNGTTRLVASLVTAAPETLRQRVGVLRELADAGEIAGIHLEGPFLSVARCGAQDPDLIIDGDPTLATELCALAGGHLVTMTIAPETPRRAEVVAALVAAGAVPSFGHTDATNEAMHEALAEATARLSVPGTRSRRPTITHLFNGMRPLHHRDPGPVPPALARARSGGVVVELVADGTHVAPALVRDVFELVGAENVALVTDAMAAAGMPDGAYRLGSQDVTVANGVARLASGGSIAGGTSRLLDVVRTTVAGGVPLREAVLAASLTPAGVLGTPSVPFGALRPGHAADVVVTDADLGVRRVLRDGVEVPLG